MIPLADQIPLACGLLALLVKGTTLNSLTEPPTGFTPEEWVDHVDSFHRKAGMRANDVFVQLGWTEFLPPPLQPEE